MQHYEDFLKQLEGENPPAVEIEALRGYFSKSGELTSPDAAAVKLVSYIVEEEEEDEVEDGVNRLWGYFLSAAVELPQERDRLVDLLGAIKNLPESMSMRDGKSLNGEWSEGMELWKGLPQFGWGLRDRWNHVDPEPSDPEQAQKRENWKNFNAFVARLTVTGVKTMLHYAEWELSTTLESAPWDETWEPVDTPADPRERQEHRHSIQLLDGNLPAAAQWIFIATEPLREKHAKPPPQEMEKKYVGKLWTEERVKTGSSKTRWEFWRERFQWAADNKDLQEATRKIAIEAVEKMA